MPVSCRADAAWAWACSLAGRRSECEERFWLGLDVRGTARSAPVLAACPAARTTEAPARPRAGSGRPGPAPVPSAPGRRRAAPASGLPCFAGKAVPAPLSDSDVHRIQWTGATLPALVPLYTV